MGKPLKQPISVLVILHDIQYNILLLERADKPQFWQSVTGSVEGNECLSQTALREVAEETSIQLLPSQLHNWHHSVVYEIYPHWRHRYPVGITHNTEHTFSVCIERNSPIQLASNEHIAYQWLPLQEAADLVFSPSNREAILQLPQYL